MNKFSGKHNHWDEFRWERELRRDERRISGYFRQLANCLDLPDEEELIYGQLSADLNICSRYDAQEFVQRQKETNASQLSDLTGGLHIHMLRVPNEEAYLRIVKSFKELNIMAEE